MTKRQLICETIGNCTNDGSNQYCYDLGHGTSVCVVVDEDHRLKDVIKELMKQCYDDGREYGATYDVS